MEADQYGVGAITRIGEAAESQSVKRVSSDKPGGNGLRETRLKWIHRVK